MTQNMTQNASVDTGLTEAVAAWISGLTRADIPDDAWAHAKLCLLDALGCGLFGSRQPWGRIAAEVALELNPAGRAHLWGRTAGTGPDAAALANGTATHGFELDDIHVRSMLHTGAVTIPGAYALAEAYDRSPVEFLTAIVAGYEVGLRIGIAAGLAHGLRGHHTTGTVGTLAATATCSRMLGLDIEATRNAIGIGATQAAGLHGARTGAMSKRFHAGRSAQSGVIAASLARKGFTGSLTALEQPFGGFFSTLCDNPDLDAVTADLGTRWEILEVGFKAYASCGSTHTTVDALDKLMAQGVRADNLKSLTVHMSRKAVSNVGWPYKPAGVVAAQMNGYYAAAAKLLYGNVFIEQFEESRLAAPEVLDVIGRIQLVHDPVFDAGGAASRHTVRVEAQTTDGRTVTEVVEHRKGSRHFPLTRSDIESKFRRLAQVALDPDAIEALIDTVQRIDDVPTMKTISGLMSGGVTQVAA